MAGASRRGRLTPEERAAAVRSVVAGLVDAWSIERAIRPSAVRARPVEVGDADLGVHPYD